MGRIVSDGPVASGATRHDAERRARELPGRVGHDASAFGRCPNQFSGGLRPPQRAYTQRLIAAVPAQQWNPTRAVADTASP